MIRKRTNLKRQGKCILRGVLLCTLNKNSDAVSGSQLLFRHGCVCHCVCVRMCVCVYPLLRLLQGWGRVPLNTCPAAWHYRKFPLNCLWKKKKKKTTNKLIIIFKLHQSRRVYYSVCVSVCDEHSPAGHWAADETLEAHGRLLTPSSPRFWSGRKLQILSLCLSVFHIFRSPQYISQQNTVAAFS